ncbi:hypothetical protein QQS21_008757 [Conoideocrella luteorostrata]|uniref:Uncharacterized protein n=1 Tax=Conoideocrella luteorostrata TaxID=1105319 RepID=A0AAJ0FVP0_9HYPO|nr:hypothetical protein QQS21_008757 [Conoideocrella luteorostrata]
MDDISTYKINAGDADIVFDFNAQLIAVSIFPSSSTLYQKQQSINNRLIDLLSHCTSPEIDDDNYKEVVDEVLGIILDARRAVFEKLQRLLSPFLHIPDGIYNLSFHQQGSLFSFMRLLPETRPWYLSIPVKRESDIDDSIPPYQNAMEIIVAETFVASAGHLAGQVEVNGEEMFCKAHGDGRGLTGSRVGRELASLHRIRNDFHLKIDTSTRIPQLLGYVHKDTGCIIGFLRQLVPGRRLKHIDNPATSAERRRKWAAQIRDTVHYLQDIEIIWGDGKAGNL